jgi:hypothetical protein
VNQGLVRGYAVATAWAAGVLVLGAIMTAILIDTGPTAPHGRQPEAS